VAGSVEGGSDHAELRPSRPVVVLPGGASDDNTNNGGSSGMLRSV
jgi:hypothetical protein